MRVQRFLRGVAKWLTVAVVCSVTGIVFAAVLASAIDAELRNQEQVAKLHPLQRPVEKAVE